MVGTGLRRLVPFAVICLVLSWVPWLVLMLLRADVNHGVAALVFALAASGPSLAALVMWLAGGGRRRRSGIRLGLWPVAAVLLGAAPPLLSAAILNGGNLPLLGQHAATVVAGVGGPLGALAYTLVSGPLSEEFGWRGYVQPRLRDHLGRTATVAVLGAAWGLWHVPLFFLVGTSQNGKGLLTVQGALFFVTIFLVTCLALFVSERLHGGVWSAILLHAAWNFANAVTPAGGNIGAILETGIFAAIAALVVLTWRRDRTGAVQSRVVSSSVVAGSTGLPRSRS